MIKEKLRKKESLRYARIKADPVLLERERARKRASYEKNKLRIKQERQEKEMKKKVEVPLTLDELEPYSYAWYLEKDRLRKLKK